MMEHIQIRSDIRDMTQGNETQFGFNTNGGYDTGTELFNLDSRSVITMIVA